MSENGGTRAERLEWLALAGLAFRSGPVVLGTAVAGMRRKNVASASVFSGGSREASLLVLAWRANEEDCADRGAGEKGKVMNGFARSFGSIALALGIVQFGAPPALAIAPAAGVVWQMASSSEHNLAHVDPRLASADLNEFTVLLQATAPLTQSPVSEGWVSLPEERWTSEIQFERDIANGSIPSFVRIVHYDNEAWPRTPLEEQKAPGTYEQRFCKLAHARGYLCATGPARDICHIAYPGSGSYTNCYLKHDLAGKAAQYADYTDIQAQALEPSGTAAYAWLVSQAAAQAVSANPHIVILGNLSPTPRGMTIAPSLMNDDARAVYPAFVAGFYMTISSTGAKGADEFLKLFEPSGPASAPQPAPTGRTAREQFPELP